MSEPFIGQINVFGFNFAPRGWSFCEGQLLAISQYSALFSLFGTTYGGDGRTTFGLPECRGRQVISPGNGPGLPSYRWGQRGGNYQHQLTTQEMPSHNHTANEQGLDCNAGSVGESNPAANFPGSTGDDLYDSACGARMAAKTGVTIDRAGGGQAFNIMNPYIAMYWNVSLQGLYPSRS